MQTTDSESFDKNSPGAKRRIAEAMLATQPSVFIHFDGRAQGVIVPAHLYNQKQIVLQWGLNMPIPIPDVVVTQSGISGTLRFKGVPFTCFIPWSSVFALVQEDSRGMVWEEAMPNEVKAEVKASERKAALRATFKVVNGERKPVFGESLLYKKPSKSHLHLVKE